MRRKKARPDDRSGRWNRHAPGAVQIRKLAMNKLTKGAIAGAAGVALLLGGGGTFALWSSSQTVTAGPVRSGVLSMDPLAEATWRDVSVDRVARTIPTAEVGSYRIVPGDTLEVVQRATVHATGANLKAKLIIEPLSLLTDSANAAFRDSLDYTVELTINGTAVTQNADGSFPVTGIEGDSSLVYTATIGFPSTVEGTALQNGTLNLNSTKVTLQQVR
jgi:alternate signal-mediated exported protein